MIVVEVTDGATVRTFTFPGLLEVVVGSTPEADLVLDASRIGRSRIKLVDRAAKIVIEDERGRVPARELKPGDEIRLREIALQISWHDETEYALAAALRERPDDLHTRAVYADWLEGSGQLDRALYLRAQIAAATASSPTEPAFFAAVDRVRELTDRVGYAWRNQFGMMIVEHCPVSPTEGYREFTEDAGSFERAAGLEIVCPLKWESLAPTDRDDVRACGICRKEVTRCTSFYDAARRTQTGQCVAVDLSHTRRGGPRNETVIGSIRRRD